jgi:hypothetical protein
LDRSGLADKRVQSLKWESIRHGYAVRHEAGRDSTENYVNKGSRLQLFVNSTARTSPNQFSSFGHAGPAVGGAGGGGTFMMTDGTEGLPSTVG